MHVPLQARNGPLKVTARARATTGLLLLSVLSTSAANHIFTWALNPSNEAVTGYCIYEQMGSPPAWIKKLEVGVVSTATISNVTVGWHIYGLVATNILGSALMSQPVSAYVPLLPSPVTNVIVNLQANVTGVSSNILASFNIPVCASEAQAFFLGKMVTETDLNIESGSSLLGPWSLVAILPVPVESTKTHLFASR